MPETASIFDHELSFDPATDQADAFLKQAPAKWVVYLLADASGAPIQLLCVKNLRYSLKRRLFPEPEEVAAATNGENPSAPPAPAMLGLSKRVDYREIVRKIFWRRVDSALEADWLYYEAARQLFPQSYRGMTGFRPAWFVHVNPESNFPRYVKTIDLAKKGILLGPVEDKHAAARLIELAEDAFDLCRYYNILVLAPNAKACAYKEMGKCPAPCDGSISMPQYRRLIEWSAQALPDPKEMLADQKQRMTAAASELRFESAGKIKAFVDELSQLGKGPFRHVRRLEDFRFLSLQRGPRAGQARLFLITPGAIDEPAGLISEPIGQNSDLLQHLLTLASTKSASIEVDTLGAERIGVVAHHLFTSKQTHGVFLRSEDVNEKSLAKAWRDLQKQKPQDEEIAGEGVMKELQAL